MTIEAIREKILTDEAFVLEEVRKIQYARHLKHVIRYDEVRAINDFSESVAEHTYTMHVIADYFLRLEPAATKLDDRKVKTMITWHDMDEIETGDKISWKKTPADLVNELDAWRATAANLSEVIKTDISQVIEEYEQLGSEEARFVKAIDKLDPLFYLYCENGKQWFLSNKLSFATSETPKITHIEPFPIMHRFMEVIHDQMKKEAFFVS